jgi:acetyl-CoA synthetase
VGEPINPEAWEWYHRVVGEDRCPIVDTWWQTETGGILISPLPGATALKPGSASWPLPGIQPAIVDEQGNEKSGAAEGLLVIKNSWPGQMRTVYGDHQRFIDTYFFGRARCARSMETISDSSTHISPPSTDVTSREMVHAVTRTVTTGSRAVSMMCSMCQGTVLAPRKSKALVLHPKVAEAAVVGYPHDIKGEGIYGFVTPIKGVFPDEELRQELRMLVRKEIGPIATPDVLQFTDALPKTRSGKIMRRILRKIAGNDTDDLGDTSTLAEPDVVERLIEGRENT